MIASGWRKFQPPVAPPSPTPSHVANMEAAKTSTNRGNATSSSLQAAAGMKFRSNASTTSDSGSCGIVSPRTSSGSECSIDAASCSSDDGSVVRRKKTVDLEWNPNVDDRCDGTWNEALLSWCKIVGHPPADGASRCLPPAITPLSLANRKRSCHMEVDSTPSRKQRTREPIKAREVCEPEYSLSKIQAPERMSPILSSRRNAHQFPLADVKHEVDEGPSLGTAPSFQSGTEEQNFSMHYEAQIPKQFIAVPIWPMRSIGKHNINLEEVLMDLRPGESGETSNQPDKWEKLFSSMGLNSQPLLPHSFSLPVPWNGRVCAGPRVPDSLADRETLEAMQWFGSLRRVEVVPEKPPRVTESLLIERENLLKVQECYQQIYRWSRGAELTVAPGDPNAPQGRLLIHGTAPKVHFA
ncbi:hypothetical protein AAVH_33819, partial [Aphelenchoides avenae]